MAPLTARRRPEPAVVGCLALVYVIWGSTYLGLKVAGDSLPPLLMLASRFAIAGPVLYWFARRRTAERVSARAWGASAVVGACLLIGGLGLVTLAERRVPTGVAALMIAAVPLWLALFDRVLHGVRLSRLALVGLGVGFAGVGFLAAPGGNGHLDGLGMLMLAGSAMFWAGGSVWGRSAPLPSEPMLAAATEMCAGAVLLTVAAALHGELGHLASVRPSWQSLLALAYLITIGSLVGYTAYTWLLATTRVSLVATYAYVNPVVAVLLGGLFLHESLHARTLLAGIVILVAVAVIVTAPPARAVGPAAKR